MEVEDPSTASGLCGILTIIFVILFLVFVILFLVFVNIGIASYVQFQFS
jgi:hypothetical protein